MNGRIRDIIRGVNDFSKNYGGDWHSGGKHYSMSAGTTIEFTTA